MSWVPVLGLLLCGVPSCLAGYPTAHAINDSLNSAAVDPGQVYRVRDLRLTRGGVKIYLNEGILAFVKPVEGRIVAAVFTTKGVEGGDAEVLAMPPTRSERSSLASFVKSPNLNDHFGTAVFFFSDATVSECLEQLRDAPSHLAPDVAQDVGTEFNTVLRNLYPSFNLNLIESILDRHDAASGFFYATFGGRDLGVFSLSFDPMVGEPVALGRISPKTQSFQLWSSFRDPRAQPAVPKPSRFREYQIHSSISKELLLSAQAEFQFRYEANDGRAVRFELSDRLTVTGASLDGRPAEVFERKTGERESGAFLLVAREPLSPGVHRVAVRYEGNVIRHAQEHAYFVEERNTWYPHFGTTFTNFDLTFQCPDNLQLVSTGELISDSTDRGVRTVHRRTPVPENVAAFNLGEYEVSNASSADYRVDVFANRMTQMDEEIGPKTTTILQTYSQWWTRLPYRTLAVSPVDGYFGQGFPGLIYLSNVTFIKEKNRPLNLRTERMDSFFSKMLLPHEIAHQWWGNLVVSADYRSTWFTEAMSTHAALEYIGTSSGVAARDAILDEYRRDLQRSKDGRTVESLGPVDFGGRLIDGDDKNAWQVITYEKGAWILRMLQSRLGAENWRQVELDLLRKFSDRPLTNDLLRQTVAQHLPAGQPDKDLSLFFETWVYSTGLPKLALTHHASQWELEVSQVANDFSVDVPLGCGGAVRWIRAGAGSNALPKSDNARSCRLPASNQFLYVQ